MSLSSRLAWLALTLLAATIAHADERLKGIACRSVHLAYEAPEAVAFYNEVTVEQSAPGTYFCVCGFGMGYYGIQELGDGKKLLIFSVWDPGKQNDPNTVADTQRVKLTYQGEGVRVKRFGNEGTGGQSFFDYDWKVGQTYRFLVTARLDGDRTEYAGYFYLPESKQWKHLVTFATLNRGKLLQGDYAFVEDFQRDRVSATKIRRARYGPGWVKTKEGAWQPLTRARFTADANPVTNIDAGLADDGRFFLATGGATENTHTKLRDLIERPTGITKAPADLPPTDQEP